MRTDRRIAELEDALITLSRILELKLGTFARDVNPEVVGLAAHFRQWENHLREHQPTP